MALKNIPVQIEVDELCDSFVKDFCSQSKKFTPAEAHKITKLVRQLSSTYSEDAMSTAIERFEASQTQIKWILGLLVALVIALFGVVLSVVLSERKQPTQAQQPPVQQPPPVVIHQYQPQQALPPVQPVEQNSGAVSP